MTNQEFYVLNIYVVDLEFYFLLSETISNRLKPKKKNTASWRKLEMPFFSLPHNMLASLFHYKFLMGKAVIVQWETPLPFNVAAKS